MAWDDHVCCAVRTYSSFFFCSVCLNRIGYIVSHACRAMGFLLFAFADWCTLSFALPSLCSLPLTADLRSTIYMPSISVEQHRQHCLVPSHLSLPRRSFRAAHFVSSLRTHLHLEIAATCAEHTSSLAPPLSPVSAVQRTQQ